MLAMPFDCVLHTKSWLAWLVSSPTTFILMTYEALRRCSIPKHRMNNPKLLFICHCQLRDTLPPCLEIWHCCNNNLHPIYTIYNKHQVNRWK